MYVLVVRIHPVHSLVISITLPPLACSPDEHLAVGLRSIVSDMKCIRVVTSAIIFCY